MIKVCVICKSPFAQSHKNINCCSNKCGQLLKQQKFDNALESHIGISIKDWLFDHYINQLWVYNQICNELHINTRTLMRYMRQFNIPIRNPSEAVKTQWVRNPNRHDDGLKIAINGATKRANFLRNHPQGCETILLNLLYREGIKFEFQYPVNSYILDFAFPEYHLDIELDNPKRVGKYFNSPKVQKRTKFLNTLGWQCLYFDKDADLENVVNIIKHLIRDNG